MKRTKLLGLVGLLFLPALLWAGVAKAQSFRTGNNSTVSADEVVTSSLYAAGRSVDIAGEVEGDVFCAGQNITVSGTVYGDVICAGQTVHISGTVRGDARVAGQTVTISGSIDGNVSAGAQSFSLTEEGRIGRDAGIGAEDIALNGQVGRDAALGGTTVTVNDSVGRDVNANAEKVTVRSQARIGGNLTYTSINRAQIADGAQITGTTKFNEKAREEGKGGYGQVLAFGFGLAFFIIITLLATALILVLILPTIFHQAAKRSLADPLKTFLTGLLASFAAPVLIIGLMMTVIGIPLGILALLVWLIVLLLAGPFFSYFLGRIILRRQHNPVLIMLAGATLVLVAYVVPILGAVAFLAAIWFGTGMILREAYFRSPKPKYDLK